MPKQYKLLTDSDRIFTLAPPTPRRLAYWTDIIGVKSFGEIAKLSKEQEISMGMKLLDINLNSAILGRAIEIFFGVDLPTEELERVDLTVFNEAFNDFFLLLLPMSAKHPSMP